MRARARGKGQEQAPAKQLPVQWEELTASDFPAAVKKAKGVCLLPIGVFEKHGMHLPLGTDVFASRAVAVGAAQEEYAVVFPWYYFGQINEARHEPGCVSIRPELLNVLLENMCDEIARNGFDKILIVNGHGGNTNWLNFFLETLLAEPREYAVYVARRDMDQEISKQVESKRKTSWGGHGDEVETSWIMAIREDLVQLDRAAQNNGRPRGNLDHLPGAKTSIWWYADFPQHYAGDARPANLELGKLALKGKIKSLVEVLRAVKVDTAACRLQDEFYARINTPLSGRGAPKGR
ncbi:MAG: creatininase family protein [Armatimonadota bacterium]